MHESTEKSKWGIKTERKLHKLRNFSSYIRQPIGGLKEIA